jgi:polyferredoxin
MLKKIRITLAVITMTLITLLFLDITGTLHHWLGWLAKIQFLPALLALNVGVIVALVVLTLVFGRIYCSVICPLGIMQDIISWLNKKKNRFSYSPEKRWLRYGMLVVFVAAFFLGINSIVALLAPYSSYGRIAQNLLKPIYEAGNNVLAFLAEHMNSYTFYSVDIWIRSLPTFIIALATLLIIGYLAWRGGRTYCNTICPVGTILSFLARFSWLKISFDEDKCKKCGRCARNCKAAAIDFKSMTVDYSRCVVCGNCLEMCNFDSLHYVHLSSAKRSSAEAAKQSPDTGRRSFLIGGTLAVAGAALAQEKKKVDGGLAVIEDKVEPKRLTPLTPPGSISLSNMHKRCTGCQLCVSQCPNEVLRPSTDLLSLMQPTMSYEHGYCRPECNRCAEVCPAGAIQPITLAQKSSTQIGHAVWVKKNCIPVTDGVECGNCERHCPVGAIEMVQLDESDELSPMVPVVNEARCIGCGACENLCPARPFSAIYVEGHEVHKEV